MLHSVLQELHAVCGQMAFQQGSRLVQNAIEFIFVPLPTHRALPATPLISRYLLYIPLGVLQTPNILELS